MSFKRVDIKTGFLCNNNCLFCVQAHNKLKGNRTTEKIIEYLNRARETGCEAVVFTGGEVTIRRDIFNIISYAKGMGFKVIQIQSNSRIMSNINYCKKLIAAGANEFSPAIHGSNTETHGKLTRSPESFNQTIQGIKNLKKLNQKVITNTVIVKPNYKEIPDIAKLLVKLKVDQFQFAFVHAIGNAGKNIDDMMPRMSDTIPYIKEGLQIGIDAEVNVMVEGIPFCMLKGYEKYCSELYIPDTEIRGTHKYDPDYKITRITTGKIKFPKCKECKYDSTCEGPWKEYPEKFSSHEFIPIR